MQWQSLSSAVVPRVARQVAIATRQKLSATLRGLCGVGVDQGDGLVTPSSGREGAWVCRTRIRRHSRSEPVIGLCGRHSAFVGANEQIDRLGHSE